MKRIFSLSMCIALLLSTMCFSAYAESVQIGSAAELIIDIGIIRGDENGYRLEDEVKRSEFAALITRFMGMEENGIKTDAASVFYDVRKEHWAYNAIGLSYELGLINGKSENTFAPDDIINVKEALKIILNALGYKDIAEQKGGYPDGYIQIASKMGLLKHLSPNKGVITRNDVCNLFYDSLEIPVVYTYPIALNDDDNVLSIYLDMQVMEGVVLGTFNHLNGYELSQDQINISGEVYKVSKAVAEKADAYLGNKVTCYVENDGSDNVIRYIKPKGYNKEITVNADDILPETTLEKFVYYNEKEHKEEKKLDEGKILFYNGSAVDYDSITVDMIKPESGIVKLKDSDGNGSFDMIIVSEYQNYVLKLVDKNVLYDKFLNEPLETEEYEENFSILKEGKNITLDDLEIGNVLSVMKSFDDKKLTIEVCTKIVEGNIVALDEDEYEIQDADGNIYQLEVSENYIDALERNLSVAKKLKLGGGTYLFRLDIAGKIADVEVVESKNSRTYAFVNKVSDSQSLSGEREVELLTQANKFEIYNFADSVKLGKTVAGKYVVSKKKASEAVRSLISNGQVKKQLIQYVLNSQQEISELYLCDDSGDPNTEYFHKDYSQEDMVYRENALDQNFYVDQNTVVFNVPVNGNYEAHMSAGKYNKYFSNGTSAVVDLYNAKDGRPDVVVLNRRYVVTYESIEDGYETIIDYVNSPVLFINEMYTSLGEDGEYATVVKGYQDGEEVTVRVSDELEANSDSAAKLKEGLAIQYETNYLETGRAKTSDEPDELIMFKIMYDFTQIGTAPGILWEYDTVVNTNAEILTMWGDIVYADDSLCSINTSLNADEVYVAGIHGGTTVMEYDEEEGFQLVNPLKIVEGKKAFIRQRYLNTREIVLY